MKWNKRINDFEDYLRFEKNFADNTIGAYTRDLQKLRVFANEKLALDPETISHEYLQEYLYQLSKEHISQRTQARWVSSVKAFFNFLFEDEIRDDNPAKLLEGPKLGLYLPDTLSYSDVEKIVAAIDESTELGQRNRCIIEVLYGCGLRVSELINLKISNINFKEMYVKIEGKGSKVRFIPLAEYTINIIQKYISEVRSQYKVNKKNEDTLFLSRRGSGLSRGIVFIIIKDLVDKVGISKTVSPHTFRHSFATHLLQNGADLRYIQEMLGHSSITTTEVYTHLKTEELRDVILNYHPRNAKEYDE